MITTNKQEAEVLELYEIWLNSYLNGDIKTYDSYLADDYHFIGSTDNEDFLNRTDTTKFFEATAEQLAGKVEIRNNRRTIEKFDELYFITDLFDAYFLNDKDWAYYGKFRFTSALKKNKEGWRFIYQHFSTPDSKAQEGETLGTQQIAAENLQLREAVQRRTIELEQKSRELEIEAALERVRARSMAMHKSSELNEVAHILFEQLRNLGGNLWGTGFGLCQENSDSDEFYFANEKGVLPSVAIPHTIDPAHFSIYEGWKNKSELFSVSKEGKELKEHYHYMLSLPQVRPFFQAILDAGLSFPEWQQWNAAYFSHGLLLIITLEPFPEPQILVRFAKVFEQAYIRFLDLQKAEAQTREAEIELALERVRARTMAMQHSEELAEASFLLDTQVRALGIKTRGCAFNIYGDNESTEWFSSEMGTMPTYKTPRENIFLRYYEEGKKGKSMYIDSYAGDACAAHYDYLCTLPVMGEALKKMIESGGSFPTQQIDHVTYFKYGYLLFITLEQEPDAHDIFIRFAKVFEQTYTRFLDLQKAEKQAREAQIEAGLERARAQSMMMQHSKELNKTSQVFHEQLHLLGIESEYSYLWLPNEDKAEHLFWATWHEEQKGRSTYNNKQVVYPLDKTDPAIAACYRAWKSKNPVHVNPVPADGVENYFNEWNELLKGVDKFKPENYPEGLFYVDAYMKYGCFGIMIRKQLSKDEQHILHRFSTEFERAYTRFLDLQKAEAQAREAQIEAALERVRSQAMAMRKSDELQEVISVVFLQMQKLGIKADASLINILKEESKDFYLWIGTEGQTYAQKIRIPYIKHPMFDVFYEARGLGKNFMTHAMTKAEKDSFFEFAFKHSDLKLMPEERQKYVMNCEGFVRSFAWSKNSGITIQNYAGIPYTNQENEILKRFALVFEQAYTRFLDVKNAEAQAREVVKQASLDRVRGEIASMRTKDDLNQITPLIWKELNALDVPFIRCGVFIMNEEKRTIQTYLSTPDGNSLTGFEMGYDAAGIATGMVKNWNANTIYQDHWDKNQFVDFMESLVKSGQVKNNKSFQGSTAPPDSLHLNFVPFKQGMLYVGNTSPLNQEILQLIQSLANSFSMAYARYEDFKQLEEAKNQTELTLSELKATQSQLIQAEKMASLGELTAGIAHEIQNPLNFVNNFSEVSNELILEMGEELDKGDISEAKEIANDIRQNLEKINHHGHRASSIVKGMLQHSRTSSDQKELTDINALADEYFRLAYHGLRAKDKSFNAKMKTDFDERIGKINVISQDIGRVILNLITNAFYAVAEKKKQHVNDFEPTVSLVSTKENSQVLISVSDNGNGIPQVALDKIFQPFFTTKPTGEGTGLGLSMSYEIITKTHGGELKVDNKPGEGATFTIILPV